MTTGATRSFLPSDLDEAHEAPLRTFAETSRNPFVRAAIFDVLWDRFGNVDYARAAIDARVECAELTDMSKHWDHVGFELGRACEIAARINDRSRLGEAIKTGIDASSLRAVREPDRGVFIGLANVIAGAVVRTGLASRVGVDPAAWGVATLIASQETRDSGDNSRGEDGLRVAAAFLAKAKRPEDVRRVRKLRVEWLLATARNAPAMLASGFAQRALDEATRHGLHDLAKEAKTALAESIQGTSKSMGAISIDISLPPELTAAMHDFAARSESPSDAIRALAQTSDLTTIPAQRLESAAREEATHALFLHMIPSVRFGNGKLAFRGLAPDDKLREAVARYASLHVEHIKLLALAFLQAAFPRFDGATLASSVEAPAWMSARHRLWLEIASVRFAAQDFASSGAILLTTYEGVLRDLVRAAGDPAVRYENGTTQDELLNTLLRKPGVRAMLGEDHAYFVEFMLCRPDLGTNLRNDLAHGSLDPRQLQADVVFLLWLLVVRLSLFERRS